MRLRRLIFSFSTGFMLFAVACAQGNVSRGNLPQEGHKLATFAGGCFWCMEPPFEKIDGVDQVISGYTGGEKKNPTYEEVSSGSTKHRESVQITYDPAKVSYSQLLDVFWHNIDPTDAGGQFADRGSQYKSAIFYHDSEQQQIAERSEADLQNSGIFDRAIVTEILRASAFYPAEDYHQDYYKKNPDNYKSYRKGSGREAFIDSVWKNRETAASQGHGIPPDSLLRKTLSPLQYHVTQEDGTEPPFDNEYWDNKAPGIYVDVVSGEVLFSSKDKFVSGTGWPSFTKPLMAENIVERVDTSLGAVRSEVRSKNADSHLGHVFPDGPPPTGLRYCMNSAALKFIPKERLEQEGYGDYLSLFDE